MSDYVKFRNLVEPPEKELESTVAKLGAELAKSGESCEIQFRFLTEEGEIRHSLVLRGAEIEDGEKEAARIEIALKLATWFEIAEGKLSPVEAWYRGRMGFRGDLDVARRLVRAAGESGEKLCPFEL